MVFIRRVVTENLKMRKIRKDEVSAAAAPRRNDAFRLLSQRLRKRSEGRPQTASEVLLRQSRDER